MAIEPNIKQLQYAQTSGATRIFFYNIKQEKLGRVEYFSIHPALRKSILTFHKLPLQSQGIHIQITINKLLTKN